MNAANQHRSVLLAEATAGLHVKPAGVYVDATFGCGGHSRAILEQLNGDGRLLVMDKDPQAIALARHEFGSDPRVHIVHASYNTIAQAALQQQFTAVDGILFDLGVSSPQLDQAERGFSFLHDGELDMRMDTSQGMTAAEYLATVSETELIRVLREYGEERYAKRIAKAIVAARMETSLKTTLQLADIIKAANPAWEKHKHPATRSFQAIRIAVNNELDELKQALEQSLAILAIGGYLVVISFHSLEDRLVKQFIKKNARGEQLPSYLPIAHQEVTHRLRIVSKPIKPPLAEIQENPRSRSAILRIVEKKGE